mmetsp:Transcript_20524/g.47345  ORF Transcript_20524/g.47345 Transcript_20524/m.47345 type:complete len:266 (+) Transcript_20524:389-1186(+)
MPSSNPVAACSTGPIAPQCAWLLVTARRLAAGHKLLSRKLPAGTMRVLAASSHALLNGPHAICFFESLMLMFMYNPPRSLDNEWLQPSSQSPTAAALVSPSSARLPQAALGVGRTTIIFEISISRGESTGSCCSNSTGMSTGRVKPSHCCPRSCPPGCPHSQSPVAACTLLRRRGERAASKSSLRSTESEVASFDRGARAIAGSSAAPLLESNAIENDSSLAVRCSKENDSSLVVRCSAPPRSDVSDSLIIGSDASSERRRWRLG